MGVGRGCKVHPSGLVGVGWNPGDAGGHLLGLGGAHKRARKAWGKWGTYAGTALAKGYG